MTTPRQTQSEGNLLVATFFLGNALFGIDAQQVQEVSRSGDITPVDDAPPHVVGIRNLRGRIVTVIDLRVRLELGRTSASSSNRILIVEWQGEQIGLLVDSVADTISTTTGALSPPPSNLHGVQRRNLVGVARGGERIVGILDLSAVLQSEDQAQPFSTPTPAEP